MIGPFKERTIGLHQDLVSYTHSHAYVRRMSHDAFSRLLSNGNGINALIQVRFDDVSFLVT